MSGGIKGLSQCSEEGKKSEGVSNLSQCLMELEAFVSV